MTQQSGGRAEPLVERVAAAAESAYGAGSRAADLASAKIDELSRFGRERPLLAMGVAFAAGYCFAKLFSR